MSPPADRLSSLPQAWVWTLMSEVCCKIQDGTHFSPKRQLPSGQYPYVTAKNVRPWGLDLSDLTFLNEEDHRAIYKRCDALKGDVFLVKDGVNTGDAAINTLDGECSLLSSVCLLRSNGAVLRGEFLRYFLLSPDGSRLLSHGMTGTAIKRIILRRIRDLPVPLAPIREQARIASEVDKHLTRLEAAVGALRRTQANLKRYRAAMLKAACEGRLVPTEAELARAEGRGYEPADQLLARILKERRARWEADQLARMVGAGKPPKDDKWKAKYKEPEARRGLDLRGLPEGWTWGRLDQLSWDAGYGTSGKCDYTSPGPPVLRIPNIQKGRIDLRDLKFARDESGLIKQDALTPGDFLVVRTNGSRDLIGRGAPVTAPFERDHFFASYLIRFRILGQGLLSGWVSCVWESDATRTVVEGVAATSAGQYNVSLGALGGIPVPLPPQREQERILDEVGRRMSMIDALETSVQTSLGRAEGLRQAILNRAFEGRLVPQDPNDEPASALLDRIRAERPRTGGGVGPKGRRSRRHPEATGLPSPGE